MSYWVSFEADVGGEEPVEIGDFSENFTSNLSAAWAHAGVWLPELKGLTGLNVARILDPVIAELEEHPERFARFDPGNGWGDHDSGLTFLKKIRDRAKAWPKARLHVSY